MNTTAASSTAGEDARRVRKGLSIACALLSFVLYASTIFTLPQVSTAQYIPERSSVAAAASNVVFGTPFLTVDTAVLDYYLKSLGDSLQSAFEETKEAAIRQNGVEPGSVQKTIRDGNGVGYAIVATAALRLFGLHAWALPLTMLLIWAVSTSAFLYRFSDRYAFAVTLHFAALTLMLFTALVWNPWYSVQINIGGIRYFSLVTLLPALHILLEIMDEGRLRRGERAKILGPLGVQTAVLTIAALVRGSAIPLLGLIAFVWIVYLWKQRHVAGSTCSSVAKAAVIGGLTVVVLGGVVLSMPREYLTEGRFQPQIWQRITESLGVNPAWPWGGVNEVFGGCRKYIPTGIQGGTVDSNGHCMWFAYLQRHNIPVESVPDQTYGGLYEKALRESFFIMLYQHPREVIATFVYDKPRLIYLSIVNSLRWNFDGDPALTEDATVHTVVPAIPYERRSIDLLLVLLVIAAAEIVVSAPQLTQTGITRLTIAAFLIAASTFPAYIAAWALPYTSGDLLFFFFFVPGLVLAAIPAIIWKSTLRVTALLRHKPASS